MPDTPPRSIAREGHAPLRIVPTEGKLSLTPASHLCLLTIDRHHNLLRGNGIDWGTGSGILAIAAATQPGVDFVLGLDVNPDDVRTARVNAEMNGVADRTGFIQADLFEPAADADRRALDQMRGNAAFLLANPPNSSGDDGLGWRRQVLAAARPLLREGAEVLLQVSWQYGEERTADLARGNGYRYHGVLERTDWVPFDQTREDLRRALDIFAAEEERSGIIYPFRTDDGVTIGAREARRRRDRHGASPSTRWQMHRFVYAG